MTKNIRSMDEFKIKDGIYLSERLKKALAGSVNRTITLVEAPTGYGKTVAVREFCKNVKIPVNWVNIYDCDPHHAWNTLCRRLFCNATGAQRFLRWPFPADEIQRAHFADELAPMLADENMLIVLDDFHQIQSEQTSEFFRFLVREFPDRIHIIIISQKNVFKDEEFLIATGKLNRIDTEDLRLSREDFHQYLGMVGVDISEEETEQIYEKSEGWISMIYVSVLNYRRMGKSDLSADMEHLVDRVAYATCSKQTQYLLSYLALLSDFTKEQADFFNGGEDSGPMLQELMSNHSFFGRDPNTGEYHFHTIFKDCIYHHFEKLSLSEQCIRYERLAEYLVQTGDYHEALRWYEKAGNYEGILRTLELLETIGSNNEDRELMIRCYDDCPKSLFEDYPLCLVLFMWRFYNYGEDGRLKECRRLFEQLMKQIQLAKEDKDYLWKSYYTFLAQSSFNDLDQMRYYMQKATAIRAEDLPKVDWDIPRTFGIPSVFHMFYRGSGKDVVKKIKDWFEECHICGISDYAGVPYIAEAEHRYFTYDIEQAEILCHSALRKCRSSHLHSFTINIQYLSAHLAYVRGDYEEVKKILGEMRAMVIREKSEDSSLTYTVDMCEAFFYEHMGYPLHLAEWIRESGRLPKEILPHAYPYAVMIKMSIGLYDKKYMEILSAEDEICPLLENCSNQLTVGNIYLIFACAAASLGRIEEAKDYIRKAAKRVELDMVVLFAKYSEWLVRPLQELVEENEGYELIIAACRRFSILQKNARNQRYTGIFPMLTKRENDIALLALDGFTNKQIAAQLFISENTVKSSMKNIFTKLGINSRRDLLRIAQMGAGKI